MADDRSTSNAKSVDLESYQAHLLDSHNELKSEFDGAVQGKEAARDGQERQGEGSSMVTGDAPTNDNRPPPEMARDQDKETFNEKWEAERESAKDRQDEYLAQLVEGYEEDKDLHNDRGHDHGHDYSR